MKYCLPLLVESIQEAREQIASAPEYDLYEVWLDYLSDWNDKEITALCEEYGSKLLCLFRRLNLESPKKKFEERGVLLDLLLDLDVVVDLDITTQREELERIGERKATLLTSYHNYERTPSHDELSKVFESMLEFQPDIIKFATFCERERDAVLLLEFLLELRERFDRVVVLGMGEFGLPTRIFGPQWGNEIQFAAQTKEKASAPGQLTRKELEIVRGVLESR